MIHETLDWPEFKTNLVSRGADVQEVQKLNQYKLYLFDGRLTLFCEVEKGSADATDYEDNFKANANAKLNNRTPIQKVNKVSITPAEGSSFVSVTHDWTDKTTWYQKSVQVTDEILTLKSGNTYEAVNDYFIDLTHGKVYDEDTFNVNGLYDITVKIDDVVQTSGYTVDYALGDIIFDSAPGGVVKCSYHYATNSEWCIKPDTGKVIMVEHSELQFTTDVVIHSPMEFQVWVWHPDQDNNPGVKIMYSKLVYKNGKDLVSTGNLGTGVIKPFDNITQEILVFPFNYLASKPFQDSVGAELRLKIVDDQPYAGEYGTATLYNLSQDE